MTVNADEIIEFWFEGINDETPPQDAASTTSRWFKRDARFDHEINDRFGKTLEAAASDKLKGWEDDKEGRLALILLLDQFSRNIYRDSPKAYENDEQALELALRTINEGFDRRYILTHRHFLFLPLMHSEDFRIQKKSVSIFEGLFAMAKEMNKPHKVSQFENVLDYAVKHHDVIEQFGRFPHRNEVLGRESTPEEIKFLKEKGQGF